MKNLKDYLLLFLVIYLLIQYKTEAISFVGNVKNVITKNIKKFQQETLPKTIPEDPPSKESLNIIRKSEPNPTNINQRDETYVKLTKPEKCYIGSTISLPGGYLKINGYNSWQEIVAYEKYIGEVKTYGYWSKGDIIKLGRYNYTILNVKNKIVYISQL